MMLRRISLLWIALSISIAAYALDFMGPPQTQLEKGRWGLDFDYTYSKNDLNFSNRVDRYISLSDSSYHVERLESIKVKKIKFHRSYANLRYAISENLEGFFKLGVTRVRSEQSFGGRQASYDGECEPSFGFGARATLYQHEDLTVGLLGQAAYTKIDDTIRGPSYPYDMDLRFWEIQVALGPTYRFNDSLSVYGGPFYHYFNGDLKMSYGDNGLFEGHMKTRVRVDSYWGGYLGLQAKISDRTAALVEYQRTESANAVAVNLALQF